MKLINKKSQQGKTEKIQFRSKLLAILLILLPFDSYLGEKVRLPIITPLILLFIFNRVSANLRFKINIRRQRALLFFSVYVLFTALLGFIKTTSLSYNLLLLMFNVVFLFSNMLSDYSESEINLFIKTAPASLLIFIFLCIINTKVYGSQVYIDIVSICDPNYFVTGMVLVVAMQNFLIFTEKRIAFRNFYRIELLIAFGFMVLIGSRGGLLACIFTMLSFLLLGTRKPISRIVPFAVLFSLIALYVIEFLPQNMIARYDLKAILHGTGSGRTIIWKNYTNLLLDSNLFTMLFGFGRDYIPTIYFGLFGHTGYYPHNLYVKTLAESGVIGLFLLTFLIYTSIKLLVKEKNGMLLSAFLGLLIGAVFLDMDNMRIFWVILSFIMSSKTKRVYMWKGKYEVV